MLDQVPEETNESRIARAEIGEAAKQFIRVVKRNKACVAGFVWGDNPPVLVQFRNISETGADLTAVLLKLSDMADEKVAKGMVTYHGGKARGQGKTQGRTLSD